MFQIEGDIFGEKGGKLSPLRPQPKTVFAAKYINVRLYFARLDQRTIHPTEAVALGAASRTGHDATLPRGCHNHLRLNGRIVQHNDVGMFFEEGQIITKGGSGSGMA